jgi:serine/threonine protein kinase
MEPPQPVTFSDAALVRLTQILISHDYALERSLGCGSFSMVFKVRSIRHQCDFAAKISDVSDPARRGIAEREQLALIRLNHPNIVRLYDYFLEGDYWFLILEYASGTCLKALIRNADGAELPNAQALFAQICEAVAHVHARRLAHRDIKPGNILMDLAGRPKLADFGLCVAAEDGETRSDMAGSPQYCAPEVLQRVPYEPKAADIWALGVTLCEIVSGKIKWPQTIDAIVQIVVTSGIQVPPDCPVWAKKLVMAMTRMNPATRPTIDAVLAVPEIRNPPKAANGDERIGLASLRGAISLVKIPNGGKAAGLKRTRHSLQGRFLLNRRSTATLDFPTPTFPDLELE